MLACIYEDRPHQLTGVKLLVLSLRRHCPRWDIRLRIPKVTDGTRSWFSRHADLYVLDQPLEDAGSYNVKPAVLRDGLSTGATACMWVDTDIIVTGSLESIRAASQRSIVVTQDPWEYSGGSTERTRAWSLLAGRDLPGPLNCAVVRVTSHHNLLLRAWLDALHSKPYRAEQARPAAERKCQMLGDQDALSALLASPQFSDIPVRRLFHGSEILQHHGAGAFSISERMQVLRHGLPPLIHAMGRVKPWRGPKSPSPLRNTRDYYERVYLELSPYTGAAREYCDDLEEDTEWMSTNTLAGKCCSMLSCGEPALAGLTQAALHRLQRNLTRGRSPAAA